MTINFDKYAQTGKAFVKKIAFELGDEENTSRASALLRATLQTLRDQSSIEESMQFISQLPMFIKAIYVDGWKPGSHKNHIRHLEDFGHAVQDKGGFAHHESSLNKLEKTHEIQAVFRVIAEYVSEGEMEDFRKTLPEELRVLLEDRIS